MAHQLKISHVNTKSMSLLLFLHLISAAAAASPFHVVQTLPGYQDTLPFKLETGYIGVGEDEDVQLFYYFVESERDPENDPLVFWINGGPGCSGFSGLVYEIGPLNFDHSSFDGSLPSFILNSYSWTKIASIIFVDAPVGTGFSYANTSRGYHSSDTKSTSDNFMFLRKWLLNHPAFYKNRLYVAGDSYGGKIVPMVAFEIAKGNDAGLQPQMNLQIATRVTAARYGVKLSPSFLVPSNWTGCLGVMNNYESLLPNKKALFDIQVARTASAYLTSLVLAISAFVADGSFNGGDNALYIRPQFFYNNPLLPFIQYVVGPYTDDLGNVLPYAVEGVGVPVDPLAFAGLLGMVVTSLNLLPCGRLEGGRMAQAMFGRSTANVLTFATSLLLAIGGLSGSVLCLSWGLFATFFRGGDEVPAKDEITPLGDYRFAWSCLLFLICFLTLFLNGGETFSSSFFGSPFFRKEM